MKLHENHKSVITVATRMRERTEEKWDSVIAITGYEGTGKTTLSIRLANAAYPAFDIEKNILYSPKVEDMKNIIAEAEPGACYIADEAIKILYKYYWQSRLQQFLNELFVLSRKFRQITVLNIPRLMDLNKYFRQHRVKYWIHCYARGRAALFIKSENPFTSDPWYIKQNEKIVDKTVKWGGNMGASLKKCRNFKMILRWSELPPRLDAKVERESIERTQIDVAEEKLGKREAKYKQSTLGAVTYLAKEQKLSQQQIVDIVGLDKSTVSRML